jgi:hypothetical protein
MARLLANRSDCTKRIIRDGSWSDATDYLRSATRFWKGSIARDGTIGFRFGTLTPRALDLTAGVSLINAAKVLESRHRHLGAARQRLAWSDSRIVLTFIFGELRRRVAININGVPLAVDLRQETVSEAGVRP